MGGSSDIVWEVVGGSDKGGILARSGVALDSSLLEDRLSTGSLVKQIALEGERLQYQKLKGTGPEFGWVSIKIKGKDLLVQAKAKVPDQVATPSTRKLRILGLHGGGSNSNIMKYQTMQLQLLLKGRAEFVFVNGGRDWKHQSEDKMLLSIADGMPLFGWYQVETDDDSDRSYNDKLFDPAVKFTYGLVEEAIERVMNYIAESGPFDVVLGFSQGCIVTHLVSAVLRSRGQEIPWKLSVSFNGLYVRDHRYMDLFSEKVRHPIVLVYGKKDEFYEYGKKQVEMYENPVILEHEEGHRFPSVNPRAKEVYREVVQHMFTHCGIEA